MQVVVESATEKDNGHQMPNLVYVSREKSKSTLHNYKAGALNVLVTIIINLMIQSTMDKHKHKSNLYFCVHALLSFEFRRR